MAKAKKQRRSPTPRALAQLPDFLRRYEVRAFCEGRGIGKTRFYEFVKRGDIKLIKEGRRSYITHAEAMRVAGLA